MLPVEMTLLHISSSQSRFALLRMQKCRERPEGNEWVTLSSAGANKCWKMIPRGVPFRALPTSITPTRTRLLYSSLGKEVAAAVVSCFNW